MNKINLYFYILENSDNKIAIRIHNQDEFDSICNFLYNHFNCKVNFEYVGREIRYRDMKYVRSLQEDSFPIFVKPVNLKQFNAGVINNIHQIGWIEPNLPDDTPCITSEVIEILSEHRCYIIDGKCEGIYHYLGDIFQFPDSEFILKCIKDFKSAPKAYSLDIGITPYWTKRGNQNIVIECNDFWSLGNYGLSPKLYCRGLMIRWRELLQLNKI